MKIPRIANSVGNIDDDLIVDAAERKTKTNYSLWLKWGSIAACLAVIIIAVTAILSSSFHDDKPTSGKYKYQVSGSETDIEWPWKYKTAGEKYQTVNFNGKSYSIKSINPIGEELIGNILGTCEVEGVDSYTNQKYTETFEVRKINGVSEEKLVAAGNDAGFYIYIFDDTVKPATFGEVLDLYGLEQNLRFNHFSVCEGYDEKGYFNIAYDTYIRQTLSECRSAILYDKADSFDKISRNYLSFTVTSNALGVYNGVVYISDDGYFATNIFNYSYIYFIGEDAAEKIINYAKDNSDEAEPELYYTLTVSGTLTEIGDGYVLIDDSILCKNREDGTVYKIFTDDIRMRRCIECFNFEIGDTVGIKYEGIISEGNEISSAYSMYKGTLVDGDLAIPE